MAQPVWCRSQGGCAAHELSSSLTLRTKVFAPTWMFLGFMPGLSIFICCLPQMDQDITPFMAPTFADHRVSPRSERPLLPMVPPMMLFLIPGYSGFNHCLAIFIYRSFHLRRLSLLLVSIASWQDRPLLTIVPWTTLFLVVRSGFCHCRWPMLLIFLVNFPTG